MTTKVETERKANLINDAADEVAAIFRRVEDEYGPSFRRNGGHRAIAHQAKERFRRKPGRKPKAAEVPA